MIAGEEMKYGEIRAMAGTSKRMYNVHCTCILIVAAEADGQKVKIVEIYGK